MNLTRRITAAVGAAGLGAAALSVALTAGPAQAATCGIWRWPVKTGADATRSQVFRTISYTTIGYLDGRVPPASFGSYAQDHRIKWPEFRTWQVNGVTLVAIKAEDDGDLHLQLRSPSGRRMIAEMPRPACVSAASPWKTQITNARFKVTSRYGIPSSWRTVNRIVNVRGLGFFDDEHGVTGASPNDIELHPVTGIKF